MRQIHRQCRVKATLFMHFRRYSINREWRFFYAL